MSFLLLGSLVFERVDVDKAAVSTNNNHPLALLVKLQSSDFVPCREWLCNSVNGVHARAGAHGVVVDLHGLSGVAAAEVREHKFLLVCAVYCATNAWLAAVDDIVQVS